MQTSKEPGMGALEILAHFDFLLIPPPGGKFDGIVLPIAKVLDFFVISFNSGVGV